MKINYCCIDKNYRRHIKGARHFAKGTKDFERAIKICDYFESVGHPHPNLTFCHIRYNRGSCSERQFAINLMQYMAYLVATNEYLATEQ